MRTKKVGERERRNYKRESEGEEGRKERESVFRTRWVCWYQFNFPFQTTIGDSGHDWYQSRSARSDLLSR